MEAARQVQSLQKRIEALTSLRATLALPADRDLASAQWAAIEGALQRARDTLALDLDRALRARLDGSALQHELGRITLKLSKAHTSFDTWLDLLSQRCVPGLGVALRGCDVLALDGLRGAHPLLHTIEPPLVYVDRGFGASVLRQGVPLGDGTKSPLPLVQIPHDRLQEKRNLASLLHEVGHQALAWLELVDPLREAVQVALLEAGTPREVAELWARWSFELAPDYWSFCVSGIAQTGALRELLTLPPEHVFHVSSGVHPPPLLRMLVSLAWCRQAWGRGPWDRWRSEWLRSYPLALAPRASRTLLEACARSADHVARLLMDHKLSALEGASITSLFRSRRLSPADLERRLHALLHKRAVRASPGELLATFVWAHERGVPKVEDELTRFLSTLARHAHTEREPVSRALMRLPSLSRRACACVRKKRNDHGQSTRIAIV